MRHPPPAEVGEEMRPARDALLHGEHPRALADEGTDGLAQVVAAPLPPATTLSSHAASAAPILAQAAPCLVATPSQLVALITFRRRQPQGPPPQAFSSSARGEMTFDVRHMPYISIKMVGGRPMQEAEESLSWEVY